MYMKQYYVLVIIICSCLPLGLKAQWAVSGDAPDDYGYTWTSNLDADNGPTFSWIDITSIGTEVTGLTDDNFVGPFTMGIDFSYYWVSRSEVYIGSNGYLSFEPGNIASLSFGFPSTPNAGGPNDVIAPFMCDLSPVGVGNPGRVFYYQDTDNDRFIVSYINMPFWTQETSSAWRGSNSFQVIMDANDSTIIFQYLSQEGAWDPAYDDDASPMVVGIENLTGDIGLLVSNNRRPLPGIAVRFDPPVTALVDVPDVDVASVQNATSSGFFLPKAGTTGASSIGLSGVIENVGNIEINSPTEVIAQVTDNLGQLVFQEQANIATLAVGQEEQLDFQIPFNPPLPGSYEYNISLTNSEDINETNNTNSAEVIVVDTTGGVALLSYAVDDTANAVFGAGGGTGTGDGGGVYFDAFGYPVLVTAVDVGVGFLQGGPQPTAGFRVEIYQANPNLPAPGTLVYTRDVSLEELLDIAIENTFWNRIELETPVVITEGGFYVSWIQLDEAFLLIADQAGPISRRTFEILDNNWAQNRSVNEEDYWIRAQIDTRLIASSVDNTLTGLEAFELYPNPTSDAFNLGLSFSYPQQISISIYNSIGQKMKVLRPGRLQSLTEQVNVSGWAKGVYMVQIQTPEGETIKRISVQ